MASLALGLLTAAPKLIQGIGAVIHSVENVFHGKSGQDKKSAVMAMTGDMLNIYSTVAPEIGLTGANSSEVNAALSDLIDAIVAFYHAAGVFQKSQKP